MGKASVVLASVALALGMLFLGSYVGNKGVGEAQAQTLATASAKPNIVFILTDDMRKDDLKYMPKTKTLLRGAGMSFQNAFVSNALCCPTRATIMRGQYSHNNGVWTNSSTDSPSTTSGGWRAYQANHNEDDNVATRLDGLGYRTALFGKYLNGYTNTTYKPPGWDRWFAAFTKGPYHYFDYDVNDNGTKRHYGTKASDYSTDVLSRRTDRFISYSASVGTPFFAYVAPLAPHLPSTPAPRDAHDYDGAKAPRLPSFDERYVSDKPPWIRKLPRLSSSQKAAINARHEKRVESLQAVDDLVAGVVGTLKNAGVMRNTYIFFTSDNGFHHGEHRIPSSKWRPYEEDVRMPLLVRGPGVPAGTTTYKLTLDTDYLPTFTDLAGAQNPPYYVDGSSLKPVLHGNVTPWRDAILLEAAAHFSPAYRGIRTVSTNTTTKSKYVEYAGGARELYRLDPDAYELANRYNSASPPTGLASRLRALKTCKANATPPEVTCQVAEGG